MKSSLSEPSPESLVAPATHPAHGADLCEASARFGGAVESWIDFSSSLNPYGLPPEILRQSVEPVAASLSRYPDLEYGQLRRCLAAAHHLQPETIWPLNGSAQGIHAVAHLCAGRPAFVPAPSFREYAHAVRIHGGFCDEAAVWAPMDRKCEGASAASSIVDKVPANGLLILGTPNSPTGDLLLEEELVEIVEACERRGTIALIDEAFLPFVEGGCERSMMSHVARFPRLLVLRSMTKTHALAGLRLGFLVGNSSLIARVRGLIPPWSVGALAVELGVRLGEYDSMIESQLTDVRRESWRFEAMLRALPRIEVRPSAANFFLCRIREGLTDAHELKAQLGRRHILIRACADYPGLDERYFRVAVRKPEENDRLILALKEELS